MRALKIRLIINTSALNSCAQRACALKVSKITSMDLLLTQVNYVECNNSTARLAWHCLSHIEIMFLDEFAWCAKKLHYNGIAFQIAFQALVCF